LNRCTGFCRPLPNHSATPPNETPGSPGAQASLPEGRRPPRRPAKSVSSSKVRIHKLTNWPFGLGITHVAKIGPIDDTASPSRDCSGREQRGGCRTWPECCVIGERSTRGSGSTHLPSGATIIGTWMPRCLSTASRALTSPPHSSTRALDAPAMLRGAQSSRRGVNKGDPC
jgi:hypothetical protein